MIRSALGRVHGLCGIWGTLSLGLFACGDYQATGSGPGTIPTIVSGQGLAGVFYHGGTTLFWAQCIGSFTICARTFTVAMIVFGVLNLFKRLCASLTRASWKAWTSILLARHFGHHPEYVISGLAAPRGMPRDTVGYVPSEKDSELVGSKH